MATGRRVTGRLALRSLRSLGTLALALSRGALGGGLAGLAIGALSVTLATLRSGGLGGQSLGDLAEGTTVKQDIGEGGALDGGGAGLDLTSVAAAVHLQIESGNHSQYSIPM